MKTSKFLLITLLWLALACPASAMTAVVEVEAGDSINALEGTLVFPSTFAIQEIGTGNSSILFWIKAPSLPVNQQIDFSGIVPGGFQGLRRIFTISGNFTEENLSAITTKNILALKNDGLGTEASIKIKIIPEEVQPDQNPPESFSPLVSSSTAIFDGKAFLAFATQDKGVGMDHYEVKEGFFGHYVIAESPYLLSHQALDQKIYIKAIDKLSHERVVTLTPQSAVRWYEESGFFAILIVALLLAVFLKKLWSRFIK